MDISTKAAIGHFFPNPSFEMIYSEAFHNAIDAGATRININISIKNYQSVETLKIEISDDGEGFTDERYDRFAHLMKIEDRRHKGLGRLIYLCYFDKIIIESVFAGNKLRKFTFDNEFSPEKFTLKDCNENQKNYSKLVFEHFANSQLKSYDNIRPVKIRDTIQNIFLPKLFALKQQGKQLTFTVSLTTEESNPAKEFYSDSADFTLNDLPHLQEIRLTNKELDLFAEQFTILYLIETNTFATKPITAICVDGRAIELDLLSDTHLPPKTHSIFLLSSTYFDEKADDSRQGITLDPQARTTIERIFIEQISNILNDKVPDIQRRNKAIREKLTSRFPHLGGYFKSNTVGLIDENKTLSEAQEVFFSEQKQILSSNDLTDEQYKLSLNHATRVLTEYILYRNIIIDKLKNFDLTDLEAKIHNLIVPMQQVLESNNRSIDIYNNNAWLLDDKYMGYRTILSDKKLNDLIGKISDGKEIVNDKLRPDIAIVFSEDINEAEHPVDVVIVELKKKKLGYLDNMTVLNQIKQRARRLLSLYPTKIQRIWFFGIVDFDNELLLEMKEEKWTPLYSKGTVYYQEQIIIPVDSNLNPVPGQGVPFPITLMSFDALWNDAKTRNETFLEILKSSICDSIKCD